MAESFGFVADRSRVDFAATFFTDNICDKALTARRVNQPQPFLVINVEPFLAPLLKQYKNCVDIAALIGQKVLKTGRAFLILTFPNHVFFDQPIEAHRQNTARNAKVSLKFIEAANAKEKLLQNFKTPLIRENLKSAFDRAWTKIGNFSISHRAKPIQQMTRYYPKGLSRTSREAFVKLKLEPRRRCVSDLKRAA